MVLVMGIATATVLLAWLSRSGNYYLLPLWERPDSPLHHELRPSGEIGRSLGIIGMSMMAVGVMIYSSRKRLSVLQRKGPMRTWLNVHIYLCLVGPILVTLHSALKFGGFAAWSYWSMFVVAASGVAGRWLYQQFPRSIKGQALSLEETRARQAEVHERLVQEFKLPAALLADVDALAKRSVARVQAHKGLLALPLLLADDIARPFRMAALRRRLAAVRRFPRRELHDIVSMVREQIATARRIAFLGLFRQLFGWWHLVHTVAFVAMVVLLVLHVAAVMVFGAVSG